MLSHFSIFFKHIHFFLRIAFSQRCSNFLALKLIVPIWYLAPESKLIALDIEVINSNYIKGILSRVNSYFLKFTILNPHSNQQIFIILFPPLFFSASLTDSPSLYVFLFTICSFFSWSDGELKSVKKSLRLLKTFVKSVFKFFWEFACIPNDFKGICGFWGWKKDWELYIRGNL